MPASFPQRRRAGPTAWALGLTLGIAASAGAPGGALAQSDAPAGAAPPAVDLNIDCTTVSDPTERLNCWDSHARATTVQKKAADKRLFGLTKQKAAAARVAPQPKRRKVRVAKARRTEDDNRRVTLTIAQVGNTPDGRLLLTASDGAVWAQTDSDTIRETPAPGATFVVRRGIPDGYICDVTRWQPVRCQREQ